MALIRGIIFDFDATLGKGQLNKQKCYSEMYELLRTESGFGLNYKDYEKAFLASLSASDKKRMDTQIEMTFSEYYGAALAYLGVSASLQLFDAMYQLVLANYSFEFYPSALDTLRELKKQGLILSIVSNTVNGTTRPMLEKYGAVSLFSSVIQSCDVGIRKPNPQIFQIALKEMGTNPNETMSVGNSPYFDIYGAQQLGMRTALVLTELSYREPVVTEVTIVPEISINSISDLLSLRNYFARNA